MSSGALWRAGGALAAALLAYLPGAGAVPLGEELAQTIPARMAADGVPGAVVVLIEAGAPVWTRAFGLADPELGLPLRADALFRVESISKPVTAWGAMRLAETGRLELDAPISDCLTRWTPPPQWPPMSARQLLSHTAGLGLGDYAARYAPGAPRPALAEHLAKDMRMIAPPGSGFAYSDTGYLLLELLIEDCTGEDFGALMTREILDPLGMNGASFDYPDAPMPVGHDLRGRRVAPYLYPGRASGGLHASAADIARFVAAGWHGADQDRLSPPGLATQHRPAVAVEGLFGFAAQAYGLGHFIETLSDGRKAVWHGGQGHGWMSHLHLLPASGDGVVILANSQRAWPLFAMILRDWSASLGVAPVGMSRVLCAESAARLGMALAIALGALALAWRVRPCGPGLRLAAGGLAAPLILWPLWAAAQDYLFLFSILPGLWPWLGAASAGAGLTLAALALTPRGAH